MDYIYDGTFEGLLNCVYFHYKSQKASGIYNISAYQQSIFNDFSIIKTDTEKAKIVAEAIVKKISQEAYIHIFYCYLSNVDYKENIILDFLIFAFKYGRKTMNFYSHEKVLPIKEAYKKVAGEAHRFEGILRFTEVENILYAKFMPDNDILIIIADHFADRYKYERLIIYDERRKKAVVYNKEKWEIKEAVNIENIEISMDEKNIQSLWKQYFTDVAIKDRENIKLQFNFVPARYRKNMVEFK